MNTEHNLSPHPTPPLVKSYETTGLFGCFVWMCVLTSFWEFKGVCFLGVCRSHYCAVQRCQRFFFVSPPTITATHMCTCLRVHYCLIWYVIYVRKPVEQPSLPCHSCSGLHLLGSLLSVGGLDSVVSVNSTSLSFTCEMNHDSYYWTWLTVVSRCGLVWGRRVELGAGVRNF